MNSACSFLTSLCASILQNGTLSHQANSVMWSGHHLLCTLQFTGISSPREQMRWCTKIHLFETISKWQFLYRRNIEIKMKQNITDDACIVDFCALKNITMLLPSEISQMQESILFFKYGFPRRSRSYSIMWHLRYQMRHQFPVIKVVTEWTMRKERPGNYCKHKSFFYWWQFQYVRADIKHNIFILYFLNRLLRNAKLDNSCYKDYGLVMNQCTHHTFFTISKGPLGKKQNKKYNKSMERYWQHRLLIFLFLFLLILFC